MVFGLISGSGNNSDDAPKATPPSVERDCKEAVKQWWLELQLQLGDEIEKTNNGNPTKPEDFGKNTDNKLQPLLDIVFFRYWNVAQKRGDKSERYIGGEQSLQLYEDLLRNNEDAAIGALKDYVKYKLISGTESDAAKDVQAKKEERVKAAKDAATEAWNKEKSEDATDKLNDQIEKAKKHSQAAPDLQKAIAVAKVYGVDTGAAEGVLKEAEEAKEKKDEEDIQKGIEKAEKKGDEIAKKKAQEHAEHQKKHNEDLKERAKKEAEQAEADATKSLEERTKKEDEAGKAQEDTFTEDFKKAVNEVVNQMHEDYKKKAFVNRQAACDAFLANAEDKSEGKDGKNFTHLSLNKTMSLENSKPFDEICAKIGFSTESYDDVVKKLDEDKEKSEKK